jgi:hypothetical protein
MPDNIIIIIIIIISSSSSSSSSVSATAVYALFCGILVFGQPVATQLSDHACHAVHISAIKHFSTPS